MRKFWLVGKDGDTLLQVFSNRTDKPHMYGFVKPQEVGPWSSMLSFNPIEFATSKDAETWVSCYDVPTLEGVYCIKAPDVQPATRTNNLRKVGLQDGSRLLSTTYDARDLTMSMYYQGVDETDAMLAYDSLQQFLVAREAYWICFANWPQRIYYVLAKLDKPTYTNEKTWTCTVTFTDLYGLSRSLGTSQGYPDDVWGAGNDMPEDVDPVYTFNTNTFSVYNLSNVMIDPDRRGHLFKMILTGHSDGNMKITNKTTGDVVQRCGPINGDGTAGASNFDGTFMIDGIRPTLNGNSDVLNVTHDQVIHLQVGKNDFQIDNFEGTISFDFPFWWFS
jgi:hypothetical protein